MQKTGRGAVCDSGYGAIEKLPGDYLDTLTINRYRKHFSS